MRKVGKIDKGEIIQKSEDRLLVCYNAVVKPQGRGGGVFGQIRFQNMLEK